MTIETVLVVDDFEPLIKAIRRMLQPMKVVGTTLGEGAVELARDARPQLALVDLVLSDRDGLLVVEDLRREFPSLMIGLMSGFLTTERAMDSIRAGATFFIEKEFDKEKLLEQIARGGAPLPSKPVTTVAPDLSLETAKRLRVHEALRATGGNKTAAARLLGIPRQSLQYMLKKERHGDTNGHS